MTVAVFALLLHMAGFRMPETAYNSECEGQDQETDHDVNGELVHHTFDTALFKSADRLRVHHNASLFTSVSNEANNPICVHKLGSLEQHLLVRQYKCTLRYLKLTLERVQIAMWRLDSCLTCDYQLVWAKLVTP